MKTPMAALLGLISIAVAGAASAQGVQVKSADAVLAPAAELYRIEDGVFALRPGMSVDLTDRAILLAFRNVERGRAMLTIAGRRESGITGTRWNLKQERQTRDAVADKSECFLDLTTLVAPKGAPPTATFRLRCI